MFFNKYTYVCLRVQLQAVMKLVASCGIGYYFSKKKILDQVSGLCFCFSRHCPVIVQPHMARAYKVTYPAYIFCSWPVFFATARQGSCLSCFADLVSALFSTEMRRARASWQEKKISLPRCDFPEDCPSWPSIEPDTRPPIHQLAPPPM